MGAILIQESWLNDNSDLSQIEIQGYSLITVARVRSSHSALAKYLNDNYKYNMLPLYNNSTVWEGLFEVSRTGLKKPAIIGKVYRPPTKITNYSADYSLAALAKFKYETRTGVPELRSPVLFCLSAIVKKLA